MNVDLSKKEISVLHKILGMHNVTFVSHQEEQDLEKKFFELHKTFNPDAQERNFYIAEPGEY
jgi:hypothetical protein